MKLELIPKIMIAIASLILAIGSIYGISQYTKLKKQNLRAQDVQSCMELSYVKQATYSNEGEEVVIKEPNMEMYERCLQDKQI